MYVCVGGGAKQSGHVIKSGGGVEKNWPKRVRVLDKYCLLVGRVKNINFEKPACGFRTDILTPAHR
jgi:hypothetical protein